MQQVGNAFGERLNNNDVLGIALDLEKRKIFYYKNGTLLGEVPHVQFQGKKKKKNKRRHATANLNRLSTTSTVPRID
jgi:hypothetical protein